MTHLSEILSDIMAEDLRANQTVWQNTIKTFKNQFTRLDKLIADARICIKDPKVV